MTNRRVDEGLVEACTGREAARPRCALAVPQEAWPAFRRRHPRDSRAFQSHASRSGAPASAWSEHRLTLGVWQERADRGDGHLAPPLRALGRGKRWLFLRAWVRLDDAQRAELTTALRANGTLAHAYQLKEHLRDVLRADTGQDMAQGLLSILRRTARKANVPMRKLHESLRSHFACAPRACSGWPCTSEALDCCSTRGTKTASRSRPPRACLRASETAVRRPRCAGHMCELHAGGRVYVMLMLWAFDASPSAFRKRLLQGSRKPQAISLFQRGLPSSSRSIWTTLSWSANGVNSIATLARSARTSDGPTQCSTV